MKAKGGSVKMAKGGSVKMAGGLLARFLADTG
jgi:hypothetical protein